MPATIVVESPTELRALVKRALEDNGPNCDLNHLDVRRVNLFSELFSATRFNGDISGWNVSNGSGFSSMFEDSHFMGDISNWDTRKAIDMTRMFANSRFDGNISKWNTVRLMVAGSMFAKSLFDGDISKWNTGRLVQSGDMFAFSKFNGDVSAWDTSSLKQSTSMFESSPFRGEVANWDMQNVWHMARMFKDSLFDGDVSRWDVARVENVEQMFAGSPFQGDLSAWTFSNLMPGGILSSGFVAMVDKSFQGNLPHCGEPDTRKMVYGIMMGGIKVVEDALKSRPFSLMYADIALTHKTKPVWMSTKDFSWFKAQRKVAHGMGLCHNDIARLIADNYAQRDNSSDSVDLQELGIVYGQ